MIETPCITDTTARLTAFIPISVPRDEMQEVFPLAIVELISVVLGQGVEIAGPVFAHHVRMEPEMFHFELGVPVSAPVEAMGRVVPGVWPAMRVARTVHHGPYEGLSDSWGEFMDWIEAEKLSPAGDLWECYVVHPDADPDPANWRTELNKPLAE